jgi:hypothetical protein
MGRERMNRRGWIFRVWILFSALWIAAWSVYGFLEWRHTIFLVTAPTGLKFEVTAPARTPNSDVLAFVQNSDLAKRRQEECAKVPGPRCQFVQSLEMPDDFAFWKALSEIIAVPIVAFALGAACIWVRSRFKRRVV